VRKTRGINYVTSPLEMQEEMADTLEKRLTFPAEMWYSEF